MWPFIGDVSIETSIYAGISNPILDNQHLQKHRQQNSGNPNPQLEKHYAPISLS